MALSLTIVFSLTACGGDEGGHGYLNETTTEARQTVAVNTETLAPEQQEQVAALADSLPDTELSNKTVKWMSFYDPWHPTGEGNSKPVSVELFEQKYGGVIEYLPTTWANQENDLSVAILGGEGVDFFPAIEAIPKYVMSGMTVSYDPYVDWDNPIWASVKDLNDRYAVGGEHYLMACQATAGYVVYYNRQTVESMGLDDPAELYKNGEWTLTKFKEMLTDFVDEKEGRFGLDGWFNCTPLYLASGTPSVSIENGKVKSNLMNPAFERAMNYQYDLYKDGLILDKSQYNWKDQVQFMGEGKELFYIGGLYEISKAPELWEEKLGSKEDVFFVPIPRDEEADAYYYNAEIDCYNLCKGAGNPEGVARLMECVIASYSDENVQKINDEKKLRDYGWSEEMLEMEREVTRITVANPVRDMHGGLPNDLYKMINDSITMPLVGGDWYSIRDSIAEAVELEISDINAKLP